MGGKIVIGIARIFNKDKYARRHEGFLIIFFSLGRKIIYKKSL